MENIEEGFNYYKVVGSGFEEDVLVRARLKVRDVVEEYMEFYRSAGKADDL